MLTTCPECRTTFRVTQEHLGLRRGLVRCGHCGVVFNGYDTLLAELVAPPVEPDKIEDAATLPIEPASELEVPELSIPAPKPESEPAAAEPAAAVGGTPAGRTAAQPGETSESILLSELSTRVRAATPPRGPRFYLQVLAALFLVGLLLLQITLYLRADLAAALPTARPFLQSLCQPFDCSVPLPHQLDKTAIAASSLEHDAENQSRARLTLLLANRTGQVQAWPHILLILTDVRDAPVAQRVFTPREYLAKGTRVEAGMTAGEEQEIRLDLDTGTLEATGYALDLAYR